jgi:hypothetical protein
MTRTTLSVLVAAVVVAVPACSGSNGVSPTAPTTSGVVAVAVSAAFMGSTVQLTATSHLADGTTHDVTMASTWESSNPQLAVVSPAGVVTPVAKGDVDVRATYQGVTGSMRLSVAPPTVASVDVTGAAASGSFQLVATAHRSDGSTQNVTSSATWQSSNTNIAAISAAGYVTVTGSGNVDLSATFGGVTGIVHATVSVARTYTVSGTVFDAASPGTPIANARVQILDGEGHTFTDASGKFMLAGVPEGRTFIEFSAAGYDVRESDVMVQNDTTLSIGLTASASQP